MSSPSTPANPAVIRVALVDDHIIVRAALRQFLREQADVRVVGESGSGRGAIDLARTVPMDVLILDIAMPDQSGLDSMAMIRAKAPAVAILVLSSHPLEQYALTTLRQGARAYLNKQCEPEEILQAVRTVAGGHPYLQPALADLLARDAWQDQGLPPHTALSNREFQIMLKLAQGERSGHIGHELSLTAKTVSAYRSKLLKKLDLHSNAELTRYAVKRRLID